MFNKEIMAKIDTVRDSFSPGFYFNLHEEERRHIAQMLNNSLGQSLSAIKFRIEHALARGDDVMNHELKLLLTSLVPLIQQTVEDVRALLMELRPSTLDDLGIIATISWFAREIESLYENVRIEQQLDVCEEDVPETLKLIIFRIVQEAVLNAVKHSEAEQVIVHLSKNSGSINLAVADSGRGINPEHIQPATADFSGCGLAKMKERALVSGGSFEIESGPGKGTAVKASWPRAETA
jgi:signal transduction histidine kinase